MTNAKAINLRVRPLQSVDLSFPCDGIIGRQLDVHLLGKAVTAFDIDGFYAKLGTVSAPSVWIPPITDPAHGVFAAGRHETLPDSDQPLGWGRLKYDSAAITAEMGTSVLFALRAEHARAALDKAVAQRENIWVQKYEAAVYEATQRSFDRDQPGSKLSRLERLATISETQHSRLHTEYADFAAPGYDGQFKDGVVKQTLSQSAVYSFPVRTLPKDGGTLQDWVNLGTSRINSQDSSQLTRGFEYRHPSLENDAQYERAQISLLDETLSAISLTNFVRGSQIEIDATDAFTQSHVSKRYLANDLHAVDLDVKRLQIAYMETLLVSPIDGVVTGVFRNIGDSVRASQAVIRVENDAEVYLVGTIKCRALIRLGQQVAISTSLFDTAQTVDVSGEVVAVRGHDSENELWDLLIRCSNRNAAGEALLPINYNFSFESTVIGII